MTGRGGGFRALRDAVGDFGGVVFDRGGGGDGFPGEDEPVLGVAAVDRAGGVVDAFGGAEIVDQSREADRAGGRTRGGEGGAQMRDRAAGIVDVVEEEQTLARLGA